MAITIEDIQDKLDVVPDEAELTHVWIKKVESDSNSEYAKYKATLYFVKNEVRTEVPLVYKKKISSTNPKHNPPKPKMGGLFQ